MTNNELRILSEWLGYKVSKNHSVEWVLEDNPDNRELVIQGEMLHYGFKRKDAEEELVVEKGFIHTEDTTVIKILAKKLQQELDTDILKIS